MVNYTNTRSCFRMKVFDNDDSTTISANTMVKNLAQLVSPQLSECSPVGWTPSKNYDDTYNLWIPTDCMETEHLERLKAWAEESNKHIWLGKNKNIDRFFLGSELDYCLASDWNFYPATNRRTEVGEAEFQLKFQFPKGLVSENNRQKYATILKSAIMDCISCLPFDWSSFVVTTIPAVIENQRKLSWALAKHIANDTCIPFVGVTLLKDKPPIKDQTVQNKIGIWRSIYSNTTFLTIPESIWGTDVLIVDDLYQSGASIWCYAEFLKRVCSAKRVIAITAVKALKDRDNT